MEDLGAGGSMGLKAGDGERAEETGRRDIWNAILTRHFRRNMAQAISSR